MKRIESFFSPWMNMKARTGEEVSELKELSVIMTIPFPGSSGVQEQLTNGLAAGLLIKKLPMKYGLLNIRNKKLGCMLCQKIGSLGIEKKVAMKISKEWTDNEII
jgi:hypothetical protein